MIKANILAVGSHPDDIEFGCGGTLAKYAKFGHKVFLMIMTGGGSGGDADIRTKEQEKSKEILGADSIFWGGYKDTFLVVEKKIIQKIETVISAIHPNFIFCHYPEDTHQDHRHLSQLVMSATRNLKNVLFYEGPTTQNFKPHVYVDIFDTIGKKMDALNAHESQVNKTNIENLSIVEMAKSNATFRGIQGRVKYAEAFSPLRLFINI